ncbi:hypothetical protein Bca4012_043671 [Brassica carinata]|uniref:Uncharacterized protein n=2 Tax=Brassica TaxID=3705 RepID=A0A3P6E6N1_BRAOL|nr:hypothetical protein HID58_086831 [Brassica napus]CAF1743026.1 unnamed protein product [Brassica napus]VDD30944.1 unnamed protein product [Brassica oleracea]
MLMGTLVYGITYTFPEYIFHFLVFALLKVCTCAPFKDLITSYSTSKCSFLNLAFDGFTNATQDSIASRYPKTETWDIMLEMNLWDTIYNMVYKFRF